MTAFIKLSRNAMAGVVTAGLPNKEQKMKLLNERVLIREVARRWAKQYDGYRGWNAGEVHGIGQKLAALDGETATAADVADIIGNDSWTRIDHCDECGAENLPVAVRLAEGTSTADICLPCLRKAVRLAKDRA